MKADESQADANTSKTRKHNLPTSFTGQPIWFQGPPRTGKMRAFASKRCRNYTQKKLISAGQPAGTTGKIRVVVYNPMWASMVHVHQNTQNKRGMPLCAQNTQHPPIACPEVVLERAATTFFPHRLKRIRSLTARRAVTRKRSAHTKAWCCWISKTLDRDGDAGTLECNE
eukprot:4776519-Pleurochrysis_carterae.AAC.1